jgi:UDP-N-acetylmuramoyl-L-alanyl-D-glutamate--2,6-diaminopimelate ligase
MNIKLKDIYSLIPESELRLSSEDVIIEDISHDSRNISSGCLFICISGVKMDGHQFAESAIQKGAVALVVERYLPTLSQVPQLIVKDARKAESVISAACFDYPSRKMAVIGVTGTNGKTTTTYLIESVLKEAGYQPGVIGTIEYRYAGKQIPSQNTTPSSLDINRLLADMVIEGCNRLVMEVSSHSLVQERVDSIDFDYGIFMNITRDHLDYHGTMENYLAAKCLLFQKLGKDYSKGFSKKSIINIDDPMAEKVIAASSVPVLTFGIKNKAEVQARNVQLSVSGVTFDVVAPSGKANIKLQISGLFNVYNSLAAISLAEAMGIPLDVTRKALESVTCVPGRFQRIDKGQDFLVLVDYAHTDDALKNLLNSARQITRGKMIIVFGAGGDRDRGKRPLMGEVAARHADYLIVTSDNPRNEDPARIALDIEIGIKRVADSEDRYKVILNRDQAIREAIFMAQPGDSVLIAGKGHETYETFANGYTIHFDDVEVSEKYLVERNRKK